MPDKDPTTWAAATWILALSMAIGGGLVNWEQYLAYSGGMG